VVYRVAQEALTNAGRHSGARNVEVALAAGLGQGVELTVRDDGHGFDRMLADGGGLGLDGMAERARLVGGELEISTGRGRGTRVTLRVPA
jgi:two-component system sensor histidine kinase UhpB